MTTVAICLSVFNGERYLAQQLDSILNQTYSDWQLYIHDDGSTDNSLKIIKDYEIRDERCHLVSVGMSEETQNLVNRASASSQHSHVNSIRIHRAFWELTKQTTADFYLFSDQDDVWKTDKLGRFLSRAQMEDNCTPILYYSNMTTVKADLSLIQEKLYHSDKAQSLSSNLVGNQVAGCSTMLNHALVSQWTYDYEGMFDSYHDSYTALLALALGKLIYIDESTIYYRQHSTNTVGVKSRFDIIKQARKMLEVSQNRARHISRTFTSQIPADKLTLLTNFSTLNHAHWWRRIFLLTRCHISRGKAAETAAVYFLLLTGKHEPEISHH